MRLKREMRLLRQAIPAFHSFFYSKTKKERKLLEEILLHTSYSLT